MMLLKKIIYFCLIMISINGLAIAKTSIQQAAELNTQSVEAQKKQFDIWKLSLKPKIMAQGIEEKFADEILQSVKYLPKVIRLDRRQVSGRMSHERYLTKVIPPAKIKRARKIYKANQQLLKQAELKTGVKAHFIVALWGKESSFGSYTGNYHVPSALATLAFDGRRGEFFLNEFIAACKILAEGHIKLKNMLGSWAGAMGNCQFMPSSFLNYALDANNDGKKDIWSDKADIFLSIGNYLKQSGWDPKATWGRQVKLTKDFSEYKFGKQHKQSVASWQQQGVRRFDMSDLPQANIDGYLIAPGGKKGRIYLVYNNFDVIMLWNRSTYFATGVGYLANRIKYPRIE